MIYDTNNHRKKERAVLTISQNLRFYCQFWCPSGSTSSLKAPPHLCTFAFLLVTFGLQRHTRRDKWIRSPALKRQRKTSDKQASWSCSTPLQHVLESILDSLCGKNAEVALSKNGNMTWQHTQYFNKLPACCQIRQKQRVRIWNMTITQTLMVDLQHSMGTLCAFYELKPTTHQYFRICLVDKYV